MLRFKFLIPSRDIMCASLKHTLINPVCSLGAYGLFTILNWWQFWPFLVTCRLLMYYILYRFINHFVLFVAAILFVFTEGVLNTIFKGKETSLKWKQASTQKGTKHTWEGTNVNYIRDLNLENWQEYFLFALHTLKSLYPLPSQFFPPLSHSIPDKFTISLCLFNPLPASTLVYI